MQATEFEQRFEAGEDILDALDLSKVRRVAQGQKRVNVDGWWSLWTGKPAASGLADNPFQSVVSGTIANAGGG